MKDYFLENFSDLIGKKTVLQYDGFITFDIIYFNKLISRLYPKQNLFIQTDDSLKKDIDKYVQCKNIFKEKGILKTYNLTSLRYYQIETGIEGPKYHNFEDPVSYLKIDNDVILIEGYHRLLYKISIGSSSLTGYEINLNL